jgi:cytochrome c oxidase assembly protein subunit 11
MGLSLIVLFMLGLTAVSVPLYRVFCQATGYEGTTQRAAAAPTKMLDRTIEVRFDSAVNPLLPWRFKPNQRSVTLHIGETGMASYHAENLGATPITGTATYNVQPDKIGKYFVKIQCFCFSEQTLKPGEAVDMPVIFYIDPKIAADRELDDVTSVTLSYTFFKADSKALEKAVDAYTQK